MIVDTSPKHLVPLYNNDQMNNHFNSPVQFVDKRGAITIADQLSSIFHPQITELLIILSISLMYYNCAAILTDFLCGPCRAFGSSGASRR